MSSSKKKKDWKSQQQAPPIPKGRQTATANNNNSQTTNGLLLLSAKKSKLLSKTHKATPTTTQTQPQLHLSAQPSTHDQLLHVMGVKTHHHQPAAEVQPDAWGVAQQQQQQIIMQTTLAQETTSDDNNHTGIIMPTAIVTEGDNSKDHVPRIVVEEGGTTSAAGLSKLAQERRAIRLGSEDAADNSPQQKITIESLDDLDLDRGESKRAQKLLFDPKSGAMVKPKAPKVQQAKKRVKRKDLLSNTPTTGSKTVEKKTILTSKTPKQISTRKLPRTCGVLYTKGNDGNYVCTDGVEADLGYGAHSVPGGRTRNPEAYQAFMKQAYEYATGYTAEDNDEYLTDTGLQTGFSVQDETLQPMEWVKADDKIELVVGADSPTLKPTAKEWAPSQAALAALQKKKAEVGEAASRTPGSVDSTADGDNEMNGVDDDEEPAIGLGFDPTVDMGFVLGSSPVHRPLDRESAARLESLSLDPKEDGARNLFSFGSSSAWGSSSRESALSSSNWGAPGKGGGVGLFSPDIFGSDTKRNDSTVSPFLNIPSGTSWGAPTKPPG